MTVHEPPNPSSPDNQTSDHQPSEVLDEFHIIFLLFDGITQLDFTGPAQALCRLPGAVVHTAAKQVQPIQTDSGCALLPSTSLADCPQADLLCVPGGFGIKDVITDDATIDFIQHQAQAARYVTSVCTGSLALGAAGLLQGKKATCHWAYTQLLDKFGAEYVEQRVVQDGRLFTAGGVTSGLDFAFTIIAEIAGKQVAEAIQLTMEYDPAPPINSGHPRSADPALVASLKTRFFDKAEKDLLKSIDSIRT